MAATVTITLSTADAARVAAWATGVGYADGKTAAIAVVRAAVETWERTQAAAAAQAAYVPIAPT